MFNQKYVSLNTRLSQEPTGRTSGWGGSGEGMACWMMTGRRHRWLEKAHAGRSRGTPRWIQGRRQRRARDQGSSMCPDKGDGEAKKGLQDVGAGSRSRSQGGRKRDPGSTRCCCDNQRGCSRTIGSHSCSRPASMGSLRLALRATVPLAHSRSGDFQILQNTLIVKVIRLS